MSQGCVTGGGGLVCTAPRSTVYFGGKDLKITDRLGSVRWSEGHAVSYFPHGEEKSSPVTADGQEKFGTYTRDNAATDYADQRYYAVGMGRFNTADPMGIAAANPASPMGWNRYAYVGGDPVNFFDPNGSNMASPDSGGFGYCDGTALYVDGMPYGCIGGGGGGGGAGGGGGGGFVCMGMWAAGLIPVPDPSCYAPGPPPPPPSAQRPLECMPTLFYRSVDNPAAQLVGANHSYWQIQVYDPNSGDYVLDEVLSGGPHAVVDPNTSNTTTYINVWVHSSYAGADQPSAGRFWFTAGLNSSNCAGVTAMDSAAHRWLNDTLPYGWDSAINSNTVAHWLGNSGGFFPGAPPGTGPFGWNP
jgi:RHS repeat-associated protein